MAKVIGSSEVMREREARVADSESRVAVADYNRLLEEYLLEVRSGRGYTDRDPSEYYYSSVRRWAQDARDWIAFRDRVMSYGLDVLNAYDETGVPPCSIAKFEEELRKIKISWTVEMVRGRQAR